MLSITKGAKVCSLIQALSQTGEKADLKYQKTPDMHLTLLKRLSTLVPTLSDICSVSGVPGASIGVLHRGESIWTTNIGYSDIGEGTKPTADTLYGIGSLTKSFIAVAAGRLVEDGHLQWRDSIKQHLPNFQPQNECVERLSTLEDALSHNTGLPNPTSFSFQGDGESLLDADQILPTVNKMKSVQPLRTQWSYSSWGYSIAGEMIEKAAGVPLPDYMKKEILTPLNMLNTTFDVSSRSEVAEPYSALSGGSAHHLLRRQDFKGSVFEAAAGMYSTVNDMLNWSKALLEALQSLSRPEPHQHGQVEQAKQVKQADQLFSAHAQIPPPALHERSYALGWIRTQLPGVVGIMGDNAWVVPIEQLQHMPRGENNSLVLYHQGSTVGYYSSIYLLPETSSAIVILTNGMGLCDAADWIAQALLTTLLDVSTDTDFVEQAKTTREALLKLDREKMKEIREGRGKGARPKPLEEYTGRYLNEAGNFVIDVREHSPNSEKLILAFQGRESQFYELRHWRDDVFEWALDWDESAKRGRYQELSSEYFKFYFELGNGSKRLRWADDPDAGLEGQYLTALGESGMLSKDTTNHLVAQL